MTEPLEQTTQVGNLHVASSRRLFNGSETLVVSLNPMFRAMERRQCSRFSNRVGHGAFGDFGDKHRHQGSTDLCPIHTLARAFALQNFKKLHDLLWRRNLHRLPASKRTLLQ